MSTHTVISNYYDSLKERISAPEPNERYSKKECPENLQQEAQLKNIENGFSKNRLAQNSKI